MKKTLAPRREDSASDDAFRLSRIYAEGWNMARKLSWNEDGELNTARVLALSPYKTEPQRSRWIEGFTKALGSEDPKK